MIDLNVVNLALGGSARHSRAQAVHDLPRAEVGANRIMAQQLATAPLSEAEYDAIAAAVMETSRGRWFLAEFTRRNRQADTGVLMGALERIERSIAVQKREPTEVDKFRLDLIEMSQAIARTRQEIQAIKQPTGEDSHLLEASGELDAIVKATEDATSEILAAAERIQELGWALREQGLDARICDGLHEQATEIYTACSFQDLTAQRTKKVVHVLRFLETRINAMIEIWKFDLSGVPEAVPPGRAMPSGMSLSQSDIDGVIVTGQAPVRPMPPMAAAVAAVTAVELHDDDLLFVTPPPAPPPPAAAPLTLVQERAAAAEAPRADMVAEAPASSPVTVEAIDRLPVEQKVRMFT